MHIFNGNARLNNINEVEKPLKKHNNQYTKMKEQEQESQGIEDFELPKSVVTRLSKEAVSYCAIRMYII